jgi:hypothetical protein
MELRLNNFWYHNPWLTSIHGLLLQEIAMIGDDHIINNNPC